MVKEIQVTANIKPGKIIPVNIPLFNYNRSLQDEIDKKRINRTTCLELLEQMLMTRALEEMIAEIVAGIYSPHFQALNILAQRTSQ